MTDKVQKIREEVERIKLCTLDEHMKFYSEAAEAEYNALCKVEEIIDSMQEEPVSIWHDASEKPERDDLLIETNDGRIIHRQSINNYGMVKRWAYTSDLLNLDNSCKFGKNLQEEPKDKCNGCNNTKGCVTCVDGSAWAHLKEASKNYADKEKFRKEVEKLKSNLIYGACSSQIAMETICKKEAFNEVLAILDTMQEEPVSEELEKAAIMHYKDVMEYEAKTGLKPAYMTSFKAGANWQKQQIMENAMPCVLGWYDGFVPEFTQEQLHNVIEKNGLDVGDKISVIILKQDD